MSKKKYRWWHAAAFHLGVQVARFTLRVAAKKILARRNFRAIEDTEFYKQQRLPAFAPPPSAFPVAWSINSFSTLAGGLHVLNLRRSESKSWFLMWQGLSWILFAAFDPAYFVLRSPINAAIVTLLYSATSLLSLRAAYRLHDEKAIASLVTTLLWLGLANPVGIAQALWNRDRFWKVGPAVVPERRWIK